MRRLLNILNIIILLLIVIIGVQQYTEDDKAKGNEITSFSGNILKNIYLQDESSDIGIFVNSDDKSWKPVHLISECNVSRGQWHEIKWCVCLKDLYSFNYILFEADNSPPVNIHA